VDDGREPGDGAAPTLPNLHSRRVSSPSLPYSRSTLCGARWRRCAALPNLRAPHLSRLTRRGSTAAQVFPIGKSRLEAVQCTSALQVHFAPLSSSARASHVSSPSAQMNRCFCWYELHGVFKSQSVIRSVRRAAVAAGCCSENRGAGKHGCLRMSKGDLTSSCQLSLSVCYRSL
jgi:hypothetical protein